MTSNLGEIPIEQHRNKFLGLANKTYFNFGGQGILPKSALDAIISTHQYIQEVGPFSGKINTWLQEKTALTRQIIAEELGTTPNTITLTENVTAGCNIALWGIDWQPGDSILMTDCEHPGVIAAVGEISRRFGVTVEICPILSTLNQGDPVAIIQQSLTPSTRLLVMSHLLWNTGQILPLKEIVDLCHNYPTDNHPIQVLVDAAQSVGSLPLNLPASGIDYYAFTGHKWLCGPAGVGGLYISENAFATLHPTFIGWRGIEIDSDGQPQNWKNNGKKFEIATSAYPEYTGLREAIAIHRQWGDAQQRYQRICQLSNYLWSSLQNISGVECLTTSPPEAGIVSFKVSGNSYSMVKNLEQQGFFLRTIAKPDCIRACVHYLTLTEEIDGLVQLLSKSTY
ncbi:MAG: aminotransferase class V-fold PLP-dependent enzyme [Xenococcaceae cyanobacterium MO_167.B27]|nr:aminotransferase class V-fold PLP-dependent enzyme [Xenococcaceae cyanobacterium MO_167.B27]